jgi:magnesium chelatase subunit D
MTLESSAPASDLTMAACLFAIDPDGLNGVLVRSRAGSNRDLWIEFLRQILPSVTPVRRVPVSVTENRLLGGLDLAATLQSGRPVAARGLLAEADGAVLVLPTAERLSQTIAAHLAAALDCRSVRLERDGLSEQRATRFGIIALDEGVDDESVPQALVERVAVHIDAAAFEPPGEEAGFDCDAIVAARQRLMSVEIEQDSIATLCSVAARFGVNSLRAPLLAIRVARASAAFAGRSKVEEPDMMLAARLVLAPRATILPASDQQQAEAPPPEPQEQEQQAQEQQSEEQQAPEPSESSRSDQNQPDDKTDSSGSTLEEVILEAASAAIPESLLARLKLTGSANMPARSLGKSGAAKQSGRLGRPIGVRAGALRDGVRLNVVETLRAAAPWQPLRRRDSQSRSSRVEVRADDFRITRYKQRTETITIFVVDASGSSAFNRLAEVKGAVELLLADCYVRRDQVALIAFRGRSAELILPPTRSLVRAKRCLAELPGGAATPLATAIDNAAALADSIRRKGQTPIVIMMTDGQANIARDGSHGRDRAVEDAISAGRRLRLAGVTALVIDTSPRARPAAARLAAEMGAQYAALPYADSQALSKLAASPRPR